MLGLHLPSELVGADVQAAPALRVTDEAGHRHRAFHHARNLFAFLDVFPVARIRTADFLGGIQLVPHGELLVRERHDLALRSEEHTSELQSLMRISYAVFCLKKKTNKTHQTI